MIGWPGFQQQVLRARVLGEPVGDHATGRTAADDDESQDDMRAIVRRVIPMLNLIHKGL